MARKQISFPRPADAELVILRVLWRRGPSSVRDVYEELSGAQQWRYTTVLKFLQIMTEKGFVTREYEGRAHVYEAAVTGDQVQRSLTGDLVEKLFAGSAQNLVIGALSMYKTTPEELAEIRKLLDEMEETGL